MRPSSPVRIAAAVSGRVMWVSPSFQSGRRVAAGTVLFRIEQARYVHQLREAEAELAARRTDLLKQEEEAQLARVEYQGFLLRDPSAVSSDFASPLVFHEPQLETARAAVAREEAHVEKAKRSLASTAVTAPFDSYVREQTVAVGQILTTGEPVGRLFAADSVEVVVPLSDEQALLIPEVWTDRESDGVGPPARVTAEFGDVKYFWEGVVDRVEAALDERTRTIDAVVKVSDPFKPGVAETPRETGLARPPLLVGKFVRVQIEGIAPKSYFRVPRAALQPGDEVWTVGDDGRVSIVPVRIFHRGNDEAFVTGALGGKQAVVTGGLQFATDDMVVQTEVSSHP